MYMRWGKNKALYRKHPLILMGKNMKKMLSILCIGILVFSGISVGANQRNYDSEIITETLSFSEPTIEQSAEFCLVNLAEKTSFLLDPGSPQLPRVTKVFILPFGTTIKSVDVELNYDSKILLPQKVLPNPEKTPLNMPTYALSHLPDKAVYESTTPYPFIDFEYSTGSGRYQGSQVLYLSVHCYPVKYLPQQDVIQYASQADISIEFEQSQYQPVFEQEYDLVIIAPSEFSESLQPLIDHKQSKAIATTIQYLDDIYNQYTGRDEAEKIKYFIYDAMQTMNISYVLLVGSIDVVPIRYTAIDVMETNGIPTDLYYADIYDEYGMFCSWDSNGNDLFGEFDWEYGPIDDVDLFADVGIGRLACSSLEEVDTVVQKIITYETETYTSNWFDTIILMGGDTFPGWSVVEGEVVLEEVAEIMDEFTPIRLFTSLDTFRPFIINANINAGAGFVSYSGHGYAQGFGTSPPDVEQRIQYYSYRLLGMRNRDKLPIVFFDACSTTQLDFTWEGFEEFYPWLMRLYKLIKGDSYDPLGLYPCFAWMLVKKENGGAIATIGSTRVAFTNVDGQGIHAGASYLNVRFFEGYEPGIAVSDMLVKAQNDYLLQVGLDCFTIEEFNLLGDPTLKVGGYV